MQSSGIVLKMAMAALLLGACGQAPEERKAMKPEDTFAGDLVTAPTRVEDTVNAAQAERMQAVEDGLSRAEGDQP